MNPAVKWIGSAIAVPVVAVALYLAFVVQLYALAWILELVGVIFG